MFLLSRLDKVKNVTGFIEGYGRCKQLQDEANVLVVGGHLNAEASQDNEERVRGREIQDRELDTIWKHLNSELHRTGQGFKGRGGKR